MGMFDNDVLFGGLRLDKEVKIGTRDEGVKGAESVALFDGQVVSKGLPTEIGVAEKTRLLIVKLKDGVPEGDPYEVSTLSQAIAAKIREGEAGDLPAVVCFYMVESSTEGFNDALVMQFLSKYDGPDQVTDPLVDPFTGEISLLSNSAGGTKPAKKTPAKAAT